ncbi:PTS sugar transporter subunit IIA [Paraglaciecola aestuariivivens]
MFKKLIDPNSLPAFKHAIDIQSPLSGKVLALDTVPHALFTARLMGEGVAIQPSGYQVFAPCSATIVSLPELANQIRLKTAQGMMLQIQLGIDSHIMMAEGFKSLVKVGDKVESGQVLMEFSLAKMKQQLKSTLCPVTIINSEKIKGLQAYYMQVRATEDRLFTVYL